VESSLSTQLESIRESLSFFLPELVLGIGVLLLVTIGLIRKLEPFITWVAFSIFLLSLILLVDSGASEPVVLFQGMARHDDFSAYLRGLIDIGALLTVLMSWRNRPNQMRQAEYHSLLVAVVLGAHVLTMSLNFLMAFLSLELISIGSYVLTGFSFSRLGTEGSLKYFLFGSVASAVMLYGISLLYGLTGTLDFSSEVFFNRLVSEPSALFLAAGLMALAGFLYKIAAAPLHLWSPDVYESAPLPIVAFFSVVPKLAGLAVLTRFTLAINLFGQSVYDWQSILAWIAVLTLTVGNFSALQQKTPKRLMAYSSIAQSGFLLVGIVSFSPSGVQFMLFYAGIYLLMNFLVFMYLQYFEFRSITTIAGFQGVGKQLVLPSVLLLVGFISLTGLPPTAGFTAKLLVFSSLWETYQLTAKPVLLVLLVFGLLNTVVSLFFYLRIPYFSFIRSGETPSGANILSFENLLGLILVLGILYLFFDPGLLMGWINKITFVL
jgi:NADH-quinone oxidoreductase subunit N